MCKLFFYLAVIAVLVILPGCFEANKSGEYSRFIREGETAEGDSSETSSLRIYSVYPEEISTEGKEKITIYGAGFQKETKVFLSSPEFEIGAQVFNPGMLEAWMPPRYQGMFIIGVKNPDGETVRWSGLLKYAEKNEQSN